MFKLLLIKPSIEFSVSSSAHTFFNACSAWLFLYPRLTRAERASSNSPFCGIEPFVDANSRESPSILLRISSMRRSAVLRPIPGIVLSFQMSLESMVLNNSAGDMPDKIVKASLGPTLLMVMSFSKILFSSAV